MKFLSVLILVIFHRNWTGPNPLREQFQVDSWFSWVSGRVAAGNLKVLLSVVLPVLLLLLLSWELAEWFLGLFWLALSLAVILYCIELVDLDRAFDDQVLWLRSLKKDDELEQVQQTHSNFRSDITYEMFQSLVPTLFWFLILGPAGALLFLLCQRYLEQVDEDDTEVDLLELVLFWMEWIPARFTVFLFALLGEFGRTWQLLLDSLADVENPAVTMLHEAVESAGGLAECADIEDFVAEGEAELGNLKDLLERSLWGWVGLAAILTIAGL
ncbi:MAG: hypothetical protein IIB71_09175 [Proteobacteria bacterium]|nr:hypothetical protein [Pseudomonadota bacterium]